MGSMYQDGAGVPQNDAEAAEWFREAAEQGDAVAQARLAAMYALGQGVEQNNVLAHMWADLAAAQGDEQSAELRDVVSGRMTPEQIAEAQQLAREWRPTGE